MKVDVNQYTDEEFNPINEFELSIDGIKFCNVKFKMDSCMDIEKLKGEGFMKETLLKFIEENL